MYLSSMWTHVIALMGAVASLLSSRQALVLENLALRHQLVVLFCGGVQHARSLLREFVACYNASRTHLALVKDAPDERAVEPTSAGPVQSKQVLGGLHHRYFRRAA